MTSVSQQQIQIELESEEQLLWASQPIQGIRLRSSDVLLIPFSLMWGGFAIFWEFSVIRSGAPFFFSIWGIPFVLIGIYLILGRFIVDNLQRSKTYYGITNNRLIIKSSKGIKCLTLRGLSDITLNEKSDGSGTISFGSIDSRYAPFADGGWPGMSRYLPPRFDMIEEVRQVYAKIREAQKSAKSVHA